MLRISIPEIATSELGEKYTHTHTLTLSMNVLLSVFRTQDRRREINNTCIRCACIVFFVELKCFLLNYDRSVGIPVNTYMHRQRARSGRLNPVNVGFKMSCIVTELCLIIIIEDTITINVL